MSTPPFNPLSVFTPPPFIPPPAPAPRPYDHLSDVNPNQGPNGTSTLGGPGLFSLGVDACFEYGIIAHITGNPDADDDPWEHTQDAITMGTYIDLGKQRAEMGNHWVMKDDNKPWGIENLDWAATDPAYHPPRPKRKKSTKVAKGKANKVMKKKAKKHHQDSFLAETSKRIDTSLENIIGVLKPGLPEGLSPDMFPSTSKLEAQLEAAFGDDDSMSICSDDTEACLERALSGETFEGKPRENDELDASPSSSGTSSSGSFQHERDASMSVFGIATSRLGTSSGSSQNERDVDMSAFGITTYSSGTSSSGSSLSGGSQNSRVVDLSAFGITTSQGQATGNSSPFDALRSSPAVNMVSEYMSTLSPPDESINLTRSYAIPVGPSKKKPVMKFTPTTNINGVNMADFLTTLKAKVPSSADRIELDSDDDDDDASIDGQYIEMDLALGVLEEKNNTDSIALRLRPDSSSNDFDEESDQDEDVDAITHLTHIKSKSKDVQGKKAIIEEI